MSELYRAKCSFNVHLEVKDGGASTKTGETRSVPTSPNFLRSANINALSLNNKVNQNIQFFTKLSTKTIGEESANNAPTSPKMTAKSKSPVRIDKEKDKDKENELGDKTNGQSGQDEDKKKALLEVRSQEERGSKSSEDLSKVGDDVNEKDNREIFLGFKEGDLFKVLSKEWELWWAVRSLDSNPRVGLVQAQLLEKTEDDASDGGETDMDQVESSLKASLDELRRRIGEDDPAGIYSNAMIPEPELMERCNQRNQPVGGLLGGLGRPMPTGGPPHVNSEGLILPRKPQNPCLDSSDRQNLHRELMFNQKIGKNVLNQKSELQRALEKHKEHQVKKEVEQQRQQNKTAFERVIEERARRLESKEKTEDKTSSGTEPEFMKVHAKLRAKMEPK